MRISFSRRNANLLEFSSIEYFNYFHIHAQEISIVGRSSTISNDRENGKKNDGRFRERIDRSMDLRKIRDSYDSLLASNFPTNIDKFRVRGRAGNFSVTFTAFTHSLVATPLYTRGCKRARTDGLSLEQLHNTTTMWSHDMRLLCSLLLPRSVSPILKGKHDRELLAHTPLSRNDITLLPCKCPV